MEIDSPAIGVARCLQYLIPCSLEQFERFPSGRFEWGQLRHKERPRLGPIQFPEAEQVTVPIYM